MKNGYFKENVWLERCWCSGKGSFNPGEEFKRVMYHIFLSQINPFAFELIFFILCAVRVCVYVCKWWYTYNINVGHICQWIMNFASIPLLRCTVYIYYLVSSMREFGEKSIIVLNMINYVEINIELSFLCSAVLLQSEMKQWVNWLHSI